MAAGRSWERSLLVWEHFQNLIVGNAALDGLGRSSCWAQAVALLVTMSGAWERNKTSDWLLLAVETDSAQPAPGQMRHGLCSAAPLPGWDTTGAQSVADALERAGHGHRSHGLLQRLLSTPAPLSAELWAKRSLSRSLALALKFTETKAFGERAAFDKDGAWLTLVNDLGPPFSRLGRCQAFREMVGQLPALSVLACFFYI